MLASPCRFAFGVIVTSLLVTGLLRGDGKVFAPRDYKGSLEERAQEAIIIFHQSQDEGGSLEDLILKIDVKGQTDKFAWVIPFPREPKTEKEDARLFQELHNYVERRLASERPRSPTGAKDKGGMKSADSPPAEVLSRKIVGSYDVAIVRENEAGALNQWLEKEGYQPLPKDAEDVVGFYRKKGYVFACVKVKDAATGTEGTADLHPLRFTFQTGGLDGIYFPMKMTGLQTEPFNVNLYIFYRYWINDKLSRHGYVHRGFSLRYRDWDSRQCEPNGGKGYSAPTEDAFLKDYAHAIPTVTRLFQKLHPGERYYLTSIQAHDLKPTDVRQWSDDLWLFSYTTTTAWVPHDVRQGGVASAAWPGEVYVEAEEKSSTSRTFWWWMGGACLVVTACVLVGVGCWVRRRAMWGLGEAQQDQQPG